MADNCCGITEDGNAFCAVPDGETKSSCNCGSTASQIEIQDNIGEKNTKGSLSFRSILMFGLACVTSPCCTPLIVPILLSLLAGTPIGLVMTQYTNVIYGVLTVLSVASLILAVRGMLPRKTPKQVSPESQNHPQQNVIELTSIH
ncbi:MAG: hypothetical protein K8I82_30610 [Anaerolineae bacterium]|nr:hypothetical protein [Anaerolineae bacterium]